MKDETRSQSGPIERIADLCNQAIARHGPDRHAIEKYVEENLGRLNAGERHRLFSELDELLQVASSPYRPGGTH